jgi:hypothetical protein
MKRWLARLFRWIVRRRSARNEGTPRPNSQMSLPFEERPAK